MTVTARHRSSVDWAPPASSTHQPAWVAVVLDDVPASRHGLATALEHAGFVLLPSLRAAAIARRAGAPAVVVVAVHTTPGWGSTADRDGLPVLHVDFRSDRAVVVSGNVVLGEASMELIGHTAAVVAAGMCVFPAGVAPVPPPPRWLDDLDGDDVTALRALAGGGSHRALADQLGLSERTAYRRLGRLYRRMGVTGRVEALLLAHHHAEAIERLSSRV